MTIIEILNGTVKDIRENIDLLAKDYKAKTGRDVCRSCPSDIQYMILSLKNLYKMTQFKFKRHAAMYKNKKGDKATISNATMTDEKAIEFLRTNPERIKLFSDYPSNWEQLIIDGVDSETAEEKEARLAAEAEAKAVAEANKSKEEETTEEAKTDENGQGSVEEEKAEDTGETDAEKEARLAAEEAVQGNAASEEKPSRDELMKMQLKDLRVKYPDIKATNIKDFVDKVLA
ncbi:MAG: hypothetical protein PVG07_00085 [Acidobacteriota bacterium]